MQKLPFYPLKFSTFENFDRLRYGSFDILKRNASSWLLITPPLDDTEIETNFSFDFLLLAVNLNFIFHFTVH